MHSSSMHLGLEEPELIAGNFFIRFDIVIDWLKRFDLILHFDLTSQVTLLKAN